jgi:hypothetical protein
MGILGLSPFSGKGKKKVTKKAAAKSLKKLKSAKKKANNCEFC